MIQRILILLCTCLFFSTRSGMAAPPNILFIYSDDQCWDTINAWGNKEVQTPNLDALTREGVSFMQTHNMGAWHGAVCVGSRTMLNTGRFVWRAFALEKAMKQEVAAGRFWSQQMKAAGYETYMSGKWHVQTNAQALFDHVSNVRPGMPNQTPQGYNRPAPDGSDPWSPSDPQFGGFWKGGKHWSEVLADDAEAFLSEAAQKDTPFFMYLAFNAPHDPRQSPQAYVDLYPPDKIKVPENFLPEYPFNQIMNAGRGLRDEKLAPFPRTPHQVQVHRSEYYAAITFMDVQIGRIMEALKKTGKADNTVIMFTSDHGLACGQHGLMGKQSMFEHSVRPPLIVAGPGIPKNKSITTPVYLQDVMPTALELAGPGAPAYVEFKSLLPLIRGEKKQQYPMIYGAYEAGSQRMVKKDGMKLITYPKGPVTLLFDLEKDPLEMRNLADLPEYAAQRKTMENALAKLQAEMDDPLLKDAKK